MIKKKFFIETKWVRKNILANILDFPYFVQSTSYTCGVACVLGILWYYGDRKRREMLLEKKLEVDEDEWAEIENIVQFFKKENFKVDSRKMTLRDLEKYLDRWIPIIVLYQARSKKKIAWFINRSDGEKGCMWILKFSGVPMAPVSRLNIGRTLFLAKEK